ncbi:MAG: hypothetical protein ACLQFR_07540 [Streptosporangiaceae bacterium]
MSATTGGSVSARGGDALEPGERAELTRLRAEVAELRVRQPPRQRHRIGWRTPIATLLIVLGCLLAPVSVLAVWTAGQVSNTSTYVANVKPLISDPAVQRAITDKITNQITSQIDVPAYTSQVASALASKGLSRAATALRGFAPSIASGLSGFIHSQVAKIVASPAVASLWVRVNTVAHTELVKALSGRGNSAIKVTNGQVTVSLEPFIMLAKQRLSARGLTVVNKLPPINPTLSLFSAKYLVKAQSAYRLINDLKIVLPIAVLVLFALGVYVARNHRRALIGAGLGLAASMFILAAGLLIFRGIYLGSVPATKLPADAAAALFDTLVRFIQESLRVVLVVGLIVAAGAFFAGPSASAVGARRSFSNALGWIRERGELVGLRTGPVGRWTYAHRKALRIGAVAVAAMIFVFWNDPDALVVIVIVAVLLLVLGLIELIGKPLAGSPA